MADDVSLPHVTMVQDMTDEEDAQFRLEVITWMCETGLGPGAAADKFSYRGLDRKRSFTYYRWGRRNKLWPPPGVEMAPRAPKSGPERDKLLVQEIGDKTPAHTPLRRHKRRASKLKPGQALIENCEVGVRAKLVEIRNSTIERIRVLVSDDPGHMEPGKEANYYANVLVKLVATYPGIMELRDEGAQKDTRADRLSRLRSAAPKG